MEVDKYRARAAELHARSELEQDPQVAATLKTIAECFNALAGTPTLPIEFFDFPRKYMFPRDPYKK
jgi:hypothetical protein